MDPSVPLRFPFGSPSVMLVFSKKHCFRILFRVWLCLQVLGSQTATPLSPWIPATPPGCQTRRFREVFLRFRFGYLVALTAIYFWVLHRTWPGIQAAPQMYDHSINISVNIPWNSRSGFRNYGPFGSPSVMRVKLKVTLTCFKFHVLISGIPCKGIILMGRIYNVMTRACELVACLWKLLTHVMVFCI